MADDSPVYPRTYRSGLLARWALGLFSLLFLVPFPAATALLVIAAFRPDWLPNIRVDVPTTLFIVPFSLLPLGPGLSGLLGALRGKLVLYEDRLEFTGIIARRAINKADIAEIRTAVKMMGVVTLTLVLKGSRRRVIQINDYGKGDDVLFAWFGEIPNAQAQAHNARVDALLGNPAFGTTPEARQKAVNAHNRIRKVLFWLTFAVGLWGFIFPAPYRICMLVLIAIPVGVFLMALFSGGRLSLTDDPKSGRLSLFYLIFVPAVVLTLRAYFDRHLLDWVPTLLWAAGVTFLLTVGVAAMERLRNAWIALGCAFFFLPYAWGGLAEANMLFDTQPSVTRLPVLDMRMSTGSRYINFYLDLPPWGPFDKPREYGVRGYLYNHTHKGGTVCGYFYQGALGWKNYVIEACPATKP